MFIPLFAARLELLSLKWMKLLLGTVLSVPCRYSPAAALHSDMVLAGLPLYCIACGDSPIAAWSVCKCLRNSTSLLVSDEH